MRVLTSAVASLTLLLAGLPVLAQVPDQSTRNPDFAARFSYESTWANPQDDVSRVCFAFASDGQYRLLRRKGAITEGLQGVLTGDQKQRLQTLLNSADFRELSGNGSGLVLSGAETFISQIPRQGGEQHVVWTNRDRRETFPQPAAEMIDWMRKFDASGGQEIRPDPQSVCPRAVKPLLPLS